MSWLPSSMQRCECDRVRNVRWQTLKLQDTAMSPHLLQEMPVQGTINHVVLYCRTAVEKAFVSNLFWPMLVFGSFPPTPTSAAWRLARVRTSARKPDIFKLLCVLTRRCWVVMRRSEEGYQDSWDRLRSFECQFSGGQNDSTGWGGVIKDTLALLAWTVPVWFVSRCRSGVECLRRGGWRKSCSIKDPQVRVIPRFLGFVVCM